MSILFAPHLSSPKGGEVFNRGKVVIAWDISDPPTDDPYEPTAPISYEIEYTEDFQSADTIWHTVKKRIPWSESSYDWVVGKMIKSEKVRVRIRARNSIDGTTSDYSMSGSDFAVNVFKLIPPELVSPISNQVYTDFILIILDETLTKETFNQKVRYTLEFSSEKREVDWTVIAQNIPVGQNIIRWDLEGLLPSDDYVLRLAAKNSATSCFQTSEPVPDQIARRFVYNLKIQQPGMFIIDTKPPQAILDIEGSSGITNEMIHTLTIFAEDDTSGVEQIQIRECDSSNQLALGNIADENLGEIVECPPITDLINENTDFDRVLGKPMGYSTKLQWTFDDKSGLRRLEALLTDTGGNTSLQENSKSFIPVFRSTNKINDLIITLEQRNNTIITEDAQGNAQIQEETAVFEVAYLSTSAGEYWVLEPFPRRIANSVSGRNVLKLFAFQGHIYLLTYTNNENFSDLGTVFRDDKTTITKLLDFSTPLSIPNAVATFQEVMYIGLENGELWEFDGASFVLLNTFANPVSTLVGDDNYLYVGLSNSSVISLYNGTSFFSSSI